eukprot:CAMPEP_0178410416 /NCGR_PEP_ID=MMETSP0689_2-20121128/20968_1 /TAXON_ID=160604 /ORGANISM="Amphidinium massartii, Strain CS-259" /LENGTH=357 /DNA_ID=CAMNT_0020031591 /DNA_START=31 /DNA_END=1104 /DNA_ORIENTATION=+
MAMLDMRSKLLLASLAFTLPAISRATSALVVVDVQDCFLPGGSLAVTDADRIIPKLVEIYQNKSCLFDVVVLTQDYHPAHHISFGSTHGLPPFSDLPVAVGGLGKGELSLTCVNPQSGTTADASCCPTYYLDSSRFDCSTQLCPGDGASSWSYSVNMSSIVEGNPACSICSATPENCFETSQRMWTDHCEQSGDSTLSSELNGAVQDFVLIQKGSNQYVDAYSAFMDNSRNLQTTLDATLQERGVTHIYLAGIATDVCVSFTAMDALLNSTGDYAVTVIGDATAGIFPSTEAAALAEFEATNGITVMNTSDILAMECPSATAAPDSVTSGGLRLTLSATLAFALLLVHAVCVAHFRA